MDTSILDSIKKLLGGAAGSGVFDTDILFWINTAFSTLTQLGIGPKDGFYISDESVMWSEFVIPNKYAEMIHTYVYIVTKLGFDPPASASILQNMTEQKKEHEWRIRVAFDELKEKGELE